ncbi:MAG: hypothetical protein DRJ40_02830 [Thermoprotei archaeon]|nr:MAG: hypothetical protein DRJ40_02830 [Thermoprotei archaeon]
MLYSLLKRKGITKETKLKFNEFTEFVFNRVWGEQGVVFHESDENLERDLKYLSKLGIVKYNENEKVIEINEDYLKTLEQIAKDLENDPLIEKCHY